MIGGDNELQGIIPNTFTHIFDHISSHNKEKIFLLQCSYLEIYNENINDLLNNTDNTRLELKEDPNKGVYVKGLSTIIVKSITDIERTMSKGTANKHTAATSMNKNSSRSHCIFTIYIETSESKKEGNLLRAGKLNLVDLAGSERQSKTKAEGDRLKEATKINLSLSALGNVISALVDNRSKHIPYRDSKLTRLLQDSLGGNTKTVMIACISPADFNYDETLGTLRYASRAKHIQNKPHVNEDPKDALLRKYEEEVKNLKNALEQLAKGGITIDRLKDTYNVQFEENTQSKGNTQPLQLKNGDAEEEKKQRERLEETLREMEQRLLCGGSEFEERKKEQASKYKEIKQKLKKQMQREKKLLADQQKAAAEIEFVEHEYKNIQEEIKEKEVIIGRLEDIYKENINEINDLKEEYQAEKDVLLNEVREQYKEIEFYKKLVESVMSEKDLEEIRRKSLCDDEDNTWKIPLFLLQGKQIIIPRLPKSKGKK